MWTRYFYMYSGIINGLFLVNLIVFLLYCQKRKHREAEMNWRPGYWVLMEAQVDKPGGRGGGGICFCDSMAEREEIKSKQKVNVILMKEEMKCACSLFSAICTTFFPLIKQFQLSKLHKEKDLKLKVYSHALTCFPFLLLSLCSQ